MKVDYDELYTTARKEHFDWVKKAGIWKARKLCELIGDEQTHSILEIGTGKGDVLNACYPFTLRIGADISSEALEQQRREYGTENLVKIDADSPLPFADNEVDFVLLCDILEHVQNPVKLLREGGRVGKNVMLKIPIEKALLFRLMQKIRSVKYGPQHPSGHLHCWRLGEVLRLIDNAGLAIVRGKFIRTPIGLIKKKELCKNSCVFVYCGGRYFHPAQIHYALSHRRFILCYRKKKLEVKDAESTGRLSPNDCKERVNLRSQSVKIIEKQLNSQSLHFPD